MERRFETISGFILAGGASRRMGRPKALLTLGGETMLDRQIRLLRAVCGSVAVVGRPEGLPESGVPIIEDALPGLGPLGGIYTGLLRTRTEYNLFVSCDLPFVDRRFLHYLCRRALESCADVTVPESPDDGLQRLCAVYRRRVLGIVRARLAAGENSVIGLLRHLRCRTLPWPEIARAKFAPRIFVNMNMRADYEAAKQILNSEF